VRDVVSSAGSVLDHVVYDSFGNITTETSASNGDRFKFAGMEVDALTGNTYDRARCYNSGIGRFTNVDPIGFAGGDTNLYRYASNGPVILTDRAGLSSDTEVEEQQQQQTQQQQKQAQASTAISNLLMQQEVLTRSFHDFSVQITGDIAKAQENKMDQLLVLLRSLRNRQMQVGINLRVLRGQIAAYKAVPLSAMNEQRDQSDEMFDLMQKELDDYIKVNMQSRMMLAFYAAGMKRYVAEEQAELQAFFKNVLRTVYQEQHP
jgi:RHS repeat-associated protein